MLKPPSRAAAAQVPVQTGSSPLRRKCPTCDAKVGQRCWNTRKTVYLEPMKGYHKARKKKSPKDLAQEA